MAIDTLAGFSYSNNGGVTAATSTLFSHTINAGSDVLLVVQIVVGNTGSTTATTTARWGGAAGTLMTAGSKRAIGNTASDFVQTFYLLNPTVQTSNVYVSSSISSTITAYAVSVNGVDRIATPDGGANGSATATANYVRNYSSFGWAVIIDITGGNGPFDTYTPGGSGGTAGAVAGFSKETTTGGGFSYQTLYTFGRDTSSGNTATWTFAGATARLVASAWITIWGKARPDVSDSITTTDLSPGENAFTTALDTFTTTDESTSEQAFIPASDSATVTDATPSVQRSADITVTDNAAVSDISSLLSIISVSDSTALTEANNSSRTTSTTDTATQADTTNSINLGTIDTFTFNDVSLLAADATRTANDSDTFTETSQLVVMHTLTDSVTQTEQVTDSTRTSSTTESTTFNDVSVVVKNINFNVSDSSTFIESVDITSGELRLGVDVSNFSESTSLVVSVDTTDASTSAEIYLESNSSATTDTATQSDTSILGFNLTDTSTQTDGANQVAQSLADTSTQSESGRIGQDRSDSMIVSESIAYGPLVSDSSIQNESRSSFAQINASDEATLLENAHVFYPLSSSDEAFLNESGIIYEEVYRKEDIYEYPEDTIESYTLPFRVIAQDVFTRKFQHWDLPVDNVLLTYTLSGPNLFQAKLTGVNESVSTLDPPLEPYRTMLYVEQGGFIRGAYIMTPMVDDNTSDTRTIEGEGFSTYPNWVIYEGPQVYGIQIDPADIIRYIWKHCQSYEDGNLRVKVDDTVTPIRRGTPVQSVNYETAKGLEASFNAGPYKLNYWDVTNMGDEVKKLQTEASIESIERAYWNESRTDINLFLELGYPRVGRQRNDLGFREGQNIYQTIPSFSENPANYASEVYVIGAGNGPGAIRAGRRGRIGRLRKVAVVQNQDITDPKRAQSIADFEFKRLSQSRYEIGSIVVDTLHPNAVWGSFQVGDDILIEGTINYLGPIKRWYRITQYVYNPYDQTALIDILPSGSFDYGATMVIPTDQLPTSGRASVSNPQADKEKPYEVGKLYAQTYLCEYFNRYDCPPGYAYCYLWEGGGTFHRYRRQIEYAVPPYVFVIGRTDNGNIITGDNIVLVSPNGTVGQKPNKTAQTNITSSAVFKDVKQQTSPTGPKTALMQAGEELLARAKRGGQIYEDFTYNGCSGNVHYYNDKISSEYWDQGGKSLGLIPFLTAIANGSIN